MLSGREEAIDWMFHSTKKVMCLSYMVSWVVHSGTCLQYQHLEGRDRKTGAKSGCVQVQPNIRKLCLKEQDEDFFFSESVVISACWVSIWVVAGERGVQGRLCLHVEF